VAKRSATGILLATMIWLILAGILAISAKFLLLPHFKKDLIRQTGSDSRYEHQVVLAADSFSGYCVLRSPKMAEALASRGILLSVQDDQADYTGRMANLKDRQVDMAVFTVDSFILAGNQIGEFPATIVLVIDETRGADAMVSYSQSVPHLEDLNHPQARVILTRNSPSEFLARTVIAHFNLPQLRQDWIWQADGAEDAYRKFKSARPSDRVACVLWEPYVSKALSLPKAQILLDSSKLTGYIVDVLVAERHFLREKPEVVRAVLEEYLRVSHEYHTQPGAMEALVMEDAKHIGGEPLTLIQAKKLVEGIEWKNTLENYAYFRLLSGPEAKDVPRLETIISNITDVLLKTGAIQKDPLGPNAHTIFYDAMLKQMKEESFHPARQLDVLQDTKNTRKEKNLEAVRETAPLRQLSEQEWERLSPVAQMRVEPISFARGTARLHLQSLRELEALAKKLASWPAYYIEVVGHTRMEGDKEANRKLAQERADAAAAILMENGTPKHRVRAIAAPSSNLGLDAQCVTFELGQLTY